MYYHYVSEVAACLKNFVNDYQMAELSALLGEIDNDADRS